MGFILCISSGLPFGSIDFKGGDRSWRETARSMPNRSAAGFVKWKLVNPRHGHRRTYERCPHTDCTGSPFAPFTVFGTVKLSGVSAFATPVSPRGNHGARRALHGLDRILQSPVRAAG